MIRQIWKRKDGRKLVTIPKDSDLQDGDYVRIEKVEDG